MNRPNITDRKMNTGMSKREHAHLRTKHRRWPLGTPVSFIDNGQVFEGMVNQHYLSTENAHACAIWVPSIQKEITISFRNLSKAQP